MASGARWKVKRTLTGDDFTREMREAFGEQWNRSGPAATRSAGAEPATYLVTRWTPFEGSIVPIPADTTVGVGRSAGAEPHDTATPSAPAIPPHISLMETNMSPLKETTRA